MIRKTQSFVIKETRGLFSARGWETLYCDLPQGSRSGIGKTAELNHIWEKLYNLSPDLVLAKEDVVIIIEVDRSLDQDYVRKFTKYQQKQQKLIEQINAIYNRQYTRLQFGFTAINGRPKPKVDIPFDSFYYLFFDGDNLILSEVTPS